MRFIAEIVRRATRSSNLATSTGQVEEIERPKARVRGKSPRARLREDALFMLA